jgi:hypothetical protein
MHARRQRLVHQNIGSQAHLPSTGERIDQQHPPTLKRHAATAARHPSLVSCILSPSALRNNSSCSAGGHGRCGGCRRYRCRYRCRCRCRDATNQPTNQRNRATPTHPFSVHAFGQRDQQQHDGHALPPHEQHKHVALEVVLRAAALSARCAPFVSCGQVCECASVRVGERCVRVCQRVRVHGASVLRAWVRACVRRMNTVTRGPIATRTSATNENARTHTRVRTHTLTLTHSSLTHTHTHLLTQSLTQTLLPCPPTHATHRSPSPPPTPLPLPRVCSPDT